MMVKIKTKEDIYKKIYNKGPWNRRLDTDSGKLSKLFIFFGYLEWWRSWIFQRRPLSIQRLQLLRRRHRIHLLPDILCPLHHPPCRRPCRFRTARSGFQSCRAAGGSIRPSPRSSRPSSMRRPWTWRSGRGTLECAVCITEFDDDKETRRLLPGCDHVFHADCIDEWLRFHSSCPVCRANLNHTQWESTPAAKNADDRAPSSSTFRRIRLRRRCRGRPGRGRWRGRYCWVIFAVSFDGALFSTTGRGELRKVHAGAAGAHEEGSAKEEVAPQGERLGGRQSTAIGAVAIVPGTGRGRGGGGWEGWRFNLMSLRAAFDWLAWSKAGVERDESRHGVWRSPIPVITVKTRPWPWVRRSPWDVLRCINGPVRALEFGPTDRTSPANYFIFL